MLVSLDSLNGKFYLFIPNRLHVDVGNFEYVQITFSNRVPVFQFERCKILKVLYVVSCEYATSTISYVSWRIERFDRRLTHNAGINSWTSSLFIFEFVFFSF